MISYHCVKTNAYFDSVTLMLFSSRMLEIPGVSQAAAMMGTNHNKALMKHAGILDEGDGVSATPNDLLIGILAETQGAVDEAVAVLEAQFENKSRGAENGVRVKTLRAAFQKMPEANFAVVSLPGKYAGQETMHCLEKGAHVLLFSDNVPLEEELRLKDYALEHGLLMMGPDCGTAILNGTALGFANTVSRGNIGLVAAAGTGLQEATVLIDRMGGGISQAIGTGGRDVKEEIGGRMMCAALELLKNDPQTTIIGIVSKPPAPAVKEKVLRLLSTLGKPVVTCFLGAQDDSLGETDTPSQLSRVVTAHTLEQAAELLVSHAGATPSAKWMRETEQMQALRAEALPPSGGFAPGQRFIRGLYTGGTLCYETMLLLEERVGKIHSNIAVDKALLLGDPEQSVENTLIDMGEDYFTDGMPHPMIDTRLRSERIVKEAQDPEVAIILLDCVLGYGCHPDPAQALVAAIERGRRCAGDRKIMYIASVCGTEGDPQKRSDQVKKLEDAQVLVLPSNAQAACLAADILMGSTALGQVDGKGGSL